ncbi:MAG: hypothetical protein ACAH21_14340 [Ramlibacter sp.]|nr:hypothetical protein [Ramlibacter sp.]
MKRRVLLHAVAASSLGSCMAEQAAAYEWDEEVQLQGAEVVVVHLKHAYERVGRTAVWRDTTLTLNDGQRTVTQLFKGFHPIFLDRDNGTWYAVLSGSYYRKSQQEPGQDWGDLEGPYGQWAVRLGDDGWKPMSMTRLPARFQEPNMLLLYGEEQEIARFHGKRVTLADKRAWLVRHPPGYSHLKLTRPIVPSQRPDRLN